MQWHRRVVIYMCLRPTHLGGDASEGEEGLQGAQEGVGVGRREVVEVLHLFDADHQQLQHHLKRGRRGAQG